MATNNTLIATADINSDICPVREYISRYLMVPYEEVPTNRADIISWLRGLCGPLEGSQFPLPWQVDRLRPWTLLWGIYNTDCQHWELMLPGVHLTRAVVQVTLKNGTIVRRQRWLDHNGVQPSGQYFFRLREVVRMRERLHKWRNLPILVPACPEIILEFDF